MNDSSSKNRPGNEDWAECPSGELQFLGERLRSDHLRDKHRAAYRTVAASALALLLLLGVGLWLRPSDSLGGITCGECFAQFDAYHSHLTGGESIDAEFANQMQEHLTNCEVCESKFEARFPGVLSDAMQSTGQILARRDVNIARAFASLL